VNFKLSKESRIGIAVVLSLVLFYWGFNFLKGKNFFSGGRTYFATFTRTGGLLTSAPVLARDFQVGVVDKIYFHPNDTGRIIVRFIIFEKNLKLPEDSKISIFATDPLGTRGLRIDLGKSAKLANSGDTLKNAIVSPTLTEQLSETFNPVSQRVESVVSSLDSLLVIIRNVFDAKTQKSLSGSFQSVEGSMKALEHASDELNTLVSNERRKIGKILGNIESVSSNLAKNNEKLASIFTNVNQISDQLARAQVEQTMLSLNKTAESLKLISEGIQAGSGTLGKLVKDDSLYVNLNSSAANLSKLLDDLEKHPKRYVHFSIFGRKDKRK
jgi:phospholipid/cholesterol/gamma-HCH transport system substrate-binding protein